MPPEYEEVRRWVIKAEHDWSAAKKVLTPDCQEPEIVAFHCQQAVEKLLKAFLASRGITFARIHDLRRLLDQCAATDATFETIRDSIEPLTLYAVAFRYPGPDDPTLDDARRALALVEHAWNFVTSRLPKETVE